MNEISGFGTVLLFIIAGGLFAAVMLLVSRILRPNRPNPEKNTTYESGEDTVGNALGNFNPRFYVIALIFILFEAELVFLFPWAIVFGDEQMMQATNGLWGVFTLVEAFIFIGILGLGLIYVWNAGMLKWDRPINEVKKHESKIPESAYTKYID